MLTTFPGYDQLNAKEKVAFQKLHEVTHDSLWSLAINNVCKNPDVMRFRRLICDLKSQNSDNPPVMRTILEPAYNYVINC